MPDTFGLYLIKNMANMWNRRYLFLICILIVTVLGLYLWTPTRKKVEVKPTKYVLNNISLFTLNIWFGDYKTTKRMSAIGRTIEALTPSIITFQEVTSSNLAYLQSQSWFGHYHMAPSTIPTNQGYFVIILCLYPIVKWRSIPFINSRMGRNLLIAELKLNIARPAHGSSSESTKNTYFTIATSHLESMPYATQEREKQLQQSLQILNEYNDVCLMGDLNLELKVDGEIELPSPWFDAWLSIGGNTHANGYTWDPANNTNAQVSEPNTTKDRFDRIFCKFLNFGIEKVNIIGTQPLDGVFLSDHFGLYAKLKYGAGEMGVKSKVKKVKFKRPKDWKKFL